MLIETAPRTLTTSEIEVTGNYGIRTEDAPHIMRILRDTMYSDRILAVIREYGANAWDAHNEAGKADKPIKVTMPSALYPFFSIRDYGSGLSEEDVIVLYTQYGASTKRGSNAAVGGLGIGNKSGFAYSTSFTVTSWFNGVCSCYSAVLDENDIGRMCKLAESPCDPQETGLEISVPVASSDYSEFRTRARNVFQFFTPRPTGVDFDSEIKPVGHDVHWFASQVYGHHYVRMGCVAYSLPEGFFRRAQLKGSFVFDLPIGSVPIAANREALKLTADTLTYLKAKILSMLDAILADAKATFQPATADRNYPNLVAFFQANQVLSMRDVLNGLLFPRSVSITDLQWPLGTLGQYSFRVPQKERYERKFNMDVHTYLHDFDRIILVGRGGDTSSKPTELVLTTAKDLPNAHTRLERMLSALCLTGIPVEMRGDFTHIPRKKSATPRAARKPFEMEYQTFDTSTMRWVKATLTSLPDVKEEGWVYNPLGDSRPRLPDMTLIAKWFRFLLGDKVVFPKILKPITQHMSDKLGKLGYATWRSWVDTCQYDVGTGSHLYQKLAMLAICDICGPPSDVGNPFRWSSIAGHPLAEITSKTFNEDDWKEARTAWEMTSAVIDVDFWRAGSNIPRVAIGMAEYHKRFFKDYGIFMVCFQAHMEAFFKACYNHYGRNRISDMNRSAWTACLAPNPSGNTYGVIAELVDETCMLRKQLEEKEKKS